MNFRFLVDTVKRLKPGEEIIIDRELLVDLNVAPSPWSIEDWVLESIPGSAYEYSHSKEPMSGNVVFRRRKDPLSDNSNCRTYVSADRRHLFTQIHNGVWRFECDREELAP